MFQTKNLLTKTNVIQDTPIYQDVYSYAKAQAILGNIDDAIAKAAELAELTDYGIIEYPAPVNFLDKFFKQIYHFRIGYIFYHNIPQ